MGNERDEEVADGKWDTWEMWNAIVHNSLALRLTIIQMVLSISMIALGWAACVKESFLELRAELAREAQN